MSKIPASNGHNVLLVADRASTLPAIVEAAGVRIACTTIASEAATAFVESDCDIAVIDLEACDGVGLDALIGAVTLDRGAALIIGRADHPELDRLIDAGATHWLSEAKGASDIARVIKLAQRYLERVGPAQERRKKRKITPETPDSAARAGMAKWLETNDDQASLLLIAFTRFDIINSAFGRETGDAAIEAVSGRIEAMARGSGARFWRLTGARFAILMTGEDVQAAGMAEAIVPRVERPVMVEGHLLSVGCRIGIAARRRGDAPGELLRRASAALTNARVGEGSPIRSMTAEDEGEALLDNALEGDLRRALDSGEIDILFQPQIAVTTGQLVGVEALARWRHPSYGELGAAKLFAIAERSDYTAALSAHVQQRAARLAAAWPATLNDVRLAINILPSDLERPDFVGQFFDMIDASGFPRDRTTVEITESGLMTDLSRAANVLAELRAGGCCVAIDDFGTGYSSLAWLKALPLDYLKIDKQLAQDIAGTSRDRVVVRSVIDMARSLGLAVIAEGVETEEQLALLAAEGCNYYQGFLFSGPVTARELTALKEAR